jgi:hypothetical protein
MPLIRNLEVYRETPADNAEEVRHPMLGIDVTVDEVLFVPRGVHPHFK